MCSGQYGTPKIVGELLAGTILCMVINIGQAVTDYYACARVTQTLPPPQHALNRGTVACTVIPADLYVFLSDTCLYNAGVMVEGLCSFIFALFALPTGVTTYSENVGTLGITRVCHSSATASRLLMFT